MNNFVFNDLLEKIEKTGLKKVSRPELICITQLVYFSGIRQKEVVNLRVFDVVNKYGDVKTAISNKKIIKHKKKKDILLPDQAINVISAYLAIMERKNPILTMKRKRLFPTYRNDRTLRYHWEGVYTNFSEIREKGIQDHFMKESLSDEALGKIYEKGSKIYRISPRQYYAIVANKKIQDGQSAYDDRLIDRIFEALEQIERIDCNRPSAQNDAAKVLAEANEAFEKIRNQEVKNNYRAIINSIISIAKSI